MSSTPETETAAVPADVPPPVMRRPPAASLPDPPALTPPSDLGAERAVLGAALNDAHALAVTLRLVRPEDFYAPENARLWRAVIEVAAGLAESERLDLVGLESALRSAGVLDEIGGRTFLIDLSESCPTTANVRFYAEIVRRKAVQRATLNAGFELARQAAQPDTDPATVLADAQAGLQRLAQDMRRATYMTATDLLAKFPTLREAVIEGILRRGEVLNIVAPPKFNKSWLLLFVAVCIALGRPVFGFPTRSGRVLLLDYELAPGTLACRLQAIFDALGVTAADLGDRLVIESLRGKRLDIDGLGAYIEGLPQGQFGVILIDPLYRTFPANMDENSNANLAALYARLQAYAEHLDAAILVVHHLSKGDQSAKVLTDLGAGGGSQSRAADAHIALRPHAEVDAAVVSGVVRSFAPFKPFVIRWRYPFWALADDLDPADLKRPLKHGGADKSKPPAEPEPPRPPVTDFVGPEPTLRASIVAKARTANAHSSERQVLAGLRAAEGAGVIFRWKMQDARLVFYSNRPQPHLENGDDQTI